MMSSRYGLRSGLLQLRRCQSTKANGIWTDFSQRAASLKINNDSIKDTLFGQVNPEKGPASMNNKEESLSYHSPLAIDETFQMAYKILENEADSKYKIVNRLKKSLENATSEKNVVAIKEQIDKYLIEAEAQNPEVLYNAEFFEPEQLDKTQPIYRHLLKQKWENYDLLVTMQRLEQLHVIPDTLPTFLNLQRYTFKNLIVLKVTTTCTQFCW